MGPHTMGAADLELHTQHSCPAKANKPFKEQCAQVEATFDAMTGSSGQLTKAQAVELLSATSSANGNGNGNGNGRLRETADLIWSEMRLPAHGSLSKVGTHCAVALSGQSS